MYLQDSSTHKHGTNLAAVQDKQRVQRQSQL